MIADRTRALEDLENNATQRNAKTSQLAGIDADIDVVQTQLSVTNEATSDIAEKRNTENRTIEQLRQQQFETVGREARLRNEVSSRTEMRARIAAQIERLEREESEARAETSVLDDGLNKARAEYSGQQTDFGRLKLRLAEAEEAHSRDRLELTHAIKAAADGKAHEESIRHRLETIGDLAVQRAYSTESVKQFFNSVRGLDWSPLGILADFIEVEPEYESLVEDFLRWKLQYVVVSDRDAAQRALDLVKQVSKGRLDCFILNGDTGVEPPVAISDALPVSSVVRFDNRIRHFNKYIRDAYIVDTVERAWKLSEQYPSCEFMSRTGEVVHGHVISWGEHEALGPLSLKREIRELDRNMDVAVRATSALQENVARLEDRVRESDILKSRLAVEVQDAEKAMLSMDHHVRSLAADLDRARQRLQLAAAEIARLIEERVEVENSLIRAQETLGEITAAKARLEQEIQSRSRNADELRLEAERLQQDLAGLQSQFAVLQERRSTVLREVNALGQQAGDLESRAREAETQIQQAGQQQQETRTTIESLEIARAGLAGEREEVDLSIGQTTTTLDGLRTELHDAEAKWDESRSLLDSWKDRYNALEIEKAKLESNLRHLVESCLNELGETIESVCLKYFESLPPTELEAREAECRDLREKLDSMGAVNMMAVEEYQEAEERFQFLTTQRQDLLDSIRDTSQAIEEIDSVCRRQFKEAFEAINVCFKEAFVSLFGGGHGELRLLESPEDAEHKADDAGVEIVAQPPGKKLQNVLLLSGGEKALTALALLIALFRYKPSPFCVLDEVDAPLDEANVDRFAQMVRDMSTTTQFIVITHSKRTMETTSHLYVVTMEEPGISKIVSVRLK